MLDDGSAEVCGCLDRLTERLAARHYLAAVVRIGKPEGQRCPRPLLARLADRCDVVVLPADEHAAQDAAWLEQRLVPCAIAPAADVPEVVRMVEGALIARRQPGPSGLGGDEVSCAC